MRQIRDDQGLREVLGLERMLSSDATGDWLRRSGLNGSLEGLAKVNRKAIKRGLKHDGIKELKIGFGMERMPCGQFEANAVNTYACPGCFLLSVPIFYSIQPKK